MTGVKDPHEYVRDLLRNCIVHIVSKLEARLIEKDFGVKIIPIENGVEEWIRDLKWEGRGSYKGRLEELLKNLGIPHEIRDPRHRVVSAFSKPIPATGIRSSADSGGADNSLPHCSEHSSDRSRAVGHKAVQDMDHPTTLSHSSRLKEPVI